MCLCASWQIGKTGRQLELKHVGLYNRTRNIADALSSLRLLLNNISAYNRLAIICQLSNHSLIALFNAVSNIHALNLHVSG